LSEAPSLEGAIENSILTVSWYCPFPAIKAEQSRGITGLIDRQRSDSRLHSLQVIANEDRLPHVLTGLEQSP
jgi:hypothetical protein